MQYAVLNRCISDPIGCWSDNPILDRSLYEEKFLNAVVQALYDQCCIYGNEYLLLEYFDNVQKDPTKISPDNQKAILNGK